MKKYKVKVNGKLYEVELEAVDEVKGGIETPKAQPLPSSAPVANGDGRPVLAPIGGNVIKVLVNPGDSVKKGQALVVIEAMKLENEVVAPIDGKVISIKVSKGNQVQSKDVLVILG